MTAEQEPALHQRTDGRERDVGKTDGHREQTDEPQRWRTRSWRDPLVSDVHRQHRKARDDETDVYNELRACRQQARREVRQAVAGEQRELEEHERGVPHRSASAELGQHHPRGHRLDREDAPRRDEADGRRDPDQRPPPRLRRRCRRNLPALDVRADAHAPDFTFSSK